MTLLVLLALKRKHSAAIMAVQGVTAFGVGNETLIIYTNPNSEELRCRVKEILGDAPVAFEEEAFEI